MIDHTYRVRLTTGTILHVVASTVQIEGDHLAFVGSKGNLSALFIVEMVGSWRMLPNGAASEMVPVLGPTSEMMHYRAIDSTPSKASPYAGEDRHCRSRL
jgi:hypothetical protein